MLIQSFLLLWAMLQVFIPGSQTMTTAAPGEACGQPNCTFEALIGKEIKTGICSDSPIPGYHDVGQQQCGNGCNCYSIDIMCTPSRNSHIIEIQDPSFCARFTEQQCQEPDAMQHCPMKCNTCVDPWFPLDNQCFSLVDKDPKRRTWSSARLDCSSLAGGNGLGDLAVPVLSNILVLAEYIKANNHSTGPYWLGGSDLLNKGMWQWINNTPIRINNTPITGYEAKPDVAHECLFMRPNGTTVPEILDNGGCGAILNFVCEKK